MTATTTARRMTELAPMTLDEFLAWDGGGHVGKLELWEGIVRAMAPASAVHGMVQLNIGTAINNHLRAQKSPCRAGTEAPIVPPLARRLNARAPDVSVTCKPPADDGTFVDPVLIVEVLSPSNQTETWESINSLTGLTSLREILVVDSTQVDVELLRRGADGGWPRVGERPDRDGVVDLTSIGLKLTVAEIYEGTPLA